MHLEDANDVNSRPRLRHPMFLELKTEQNSFQFQGLAADWKCLVPRVQIMAVDFSIQLR